MVVFIIIFTRNTQYGAQINGLVYQIVGEYFRLPVRGEKINPPPNRLITLGRIRHCQSKEDLLIDFSFGKE